MVKRKCNNTPTGDLTVLLAKLAKGLALFSNRMVTPICQNIWFVSMLVKSVNTWKFIVVGQNALLSEVLRKNTSLTDVDQPPTIHWPHPPN